jgi:hypothetical protein
VSRAVAILAEALGLDPSASPDAVAVRLADWLLEGSTGHQEPPTDFLGGDFLSAVAKFTECGVPFGVAASFVSREAPELYWQHVKQSELN